MTIGNINNTLAADMQYLGYYLGQSIKHIIYGGVDPKILGKAIYAEVNSYFVFDDEVDKKWPSSRPL